MAYTLCFCIRKEKVKLVDPWLFGRNDAEAETAVLWTPHVKSWLTGKDSDGGRDWGTGGEGDDRGWDGWMASLTRWRWVWVNSGSWWWTGRPGVLRFMGSQRVRHDWATELNWTRVSSSGLGWSSLDRSSNGVDSTVFIGFPFSTVTSSHFPTSNSFFFPINSLAHTCSGMSNSCDPMDCSLPGSSVPWIFLARILEQVAISSSRGSSQPSDRTHISCASCIGRQILYHSAIWESPSNKWLSSKF